MATSTSREGDPGMARMIFVNLPVKDLERSKDFFGRLGFSFNPQYTDHTAACMVVSDEIYVMLLTHEKFQQFSPNPVGDATRSTEVLVCLSCESRAEVDDTISKAVAAGGRTFSQPIDMGPMYGRSFQDLDGHVWELLCMQAATVGQV